MFQIGQSVRVGKSVGSAIKAGSVATIVSGPQTINGTRGIYTVELNGVQEQFHESRLGVV
jgi:hypothetical protein